MSEYSTAHIDYLARAFLDDYGGTLSEPFPAKDFAIPAPKSFHLLRVAEIGRTWSKGRSERGSERVRHRSEDVLTGCFGGKLPIIAGVLGRSGETNYLLGTFAGTNSQGLQVEGGNALTTLRALLDAEYPGSRFEPFTAASLAELLSETMDGGCLGLITGLPTAKIGDDVEKSTQIDRLIRAMSGQTWGFLGFAEPVSSKQISALHHAAINEMRSVENAEQVNVRRGPLAEAYLKDLDLLVREFAQGTATGMWVASLFFFAPNRDTFQALRSIIASCFGGEESKPDPVRTIEIERSENLQRGLGQILIQAPAAPGVFRYPYSFQTLLSSTRLASYFHLPRLEDKGFEVHDSYRFDINPPPAGDHACISLGAVLDRQHPVKQTYAITTLALNKHALIAGVTGSGKTTTCFRIVTELWKVGIPFLVIEPAKREYRSLRSDQLIGSDLRVFTLGDERVSPLRINPFEVEPGLSVSTHIDLLKSVFNASFGMWTPLPQVLERSLHLIYRDCGWDPVRGINRRSSSDSTTFEAAFPTLTDLYNKVSEVVGNLGYEERITSDIKAALLTRIDGLRVGGKGVMLDTQRSVPTADLLEKPTIIELEQIGDDDEKAFLMGLLLVRFYEHLRAGQSRARAELSDGVGDNTAPLKKDSLRHVMVVEEAHRLLANVAISSNPEEPNARGKAVETFSNMLSEVRAYGQGFMVVEQIPSKLALDVIKNTNLKIVHRTVAYDDREILGRSMNMDEPGRETLATLRVRQAAVFSEGDDRPILVQTPELQIKKSSPSESDQEVTKAMDAFRKKEAIANFFIPFDRCPQACGEPYRYCADVRELVSRPDFQILFVPLVLALIVEGGSPLLFARTLADYLNARLTQGASGREGFSCVVLNAVRWFLTDYGRRYDWPYSTVERLRGPLVEALLKILPPLASPGGVPADFDIARDEFARLYHQACKRTYDPFPACSAICPTGECLFRFSAERLLDDHKLSSLFSEAMNKAHGGRWDDFKAINEAIRRLVGHEAAHEIRRSAGLCYGTQKIAATPGLLEFACEEPNQLMLDGFDNHASQKKEAGVGP